MTDADQKTAADALLNDLDLGSGKKREKTSIPGYARSVPKRTYLLAITAVVALLLNFWANHAVQFAPRENPNLTILFWFGMISSVTYVFFQVTTAGALFTFLAHLHAKETLARTIATQRALQRDGRR